LPFALFLFEALFGYSLNNHRVSVFSHHGPHGSPSQGVGFEFRFLHHQHPSRITKRVTVIAPITANALIISCIMPWPSGAR
jgi:type VI protein secretion system component Hcp